MKGTQIKIKPVTRIEGHLQVDIEISGNDVNVRLRAGEFRGFERILVGRPVEEVVNIVPRVCGVCSVAHHLASVKAVEAALGIEPPQVAEITRKIMGLGGVAQSHLLHMGFLMLPDVIKVHGAGDVYTTRLFKSISVLYSIALKITSISGGRHVHPFNAVPGGVLRALSREDVESIRKEAEVGLKTLSELSGEIINLLGKFIEDNAIDISQGKTSLIALVNGEKDPMFYEGAVKVVRSDGYEELVSPSEYSKLVREEPVEYSYSKRVYLDVGGSRDVIRVGPLPRLLVAPYEQRDLGKDLYKYFDVVNRKWPNHVLVYNLARLVEVAYCFEKILALLDELRVVGGEPRSQVALKEGEGVGVVEAPRGLLIHHYKCNSNGIVTYANIITPTTINIAAIEQDVKETVKSLIAKSLDDPEYVKTKVLYLVRSYDPCISCATHSIRVIKKSGTKQ